MKLTKYFWTALLIMMILFLVPYLKTKDHPDVDGRAIWGFPFTFYSYGGECYNEEVGGFSCKGFFNPVYLILDMLIILLVPFVINYIIVKNK